MKSPSPSVEIVISGKRACFTRPDANAERVSYLIPPVSAIHGLVAGIHIKVKELEWNVGLIKMLSAPQTAMVRYNELKNPAGPRNVNTFSILGNRAQRYTTELVNPRFVVRVSPVIKGRPCGTNNAQKHINILTKRLQRGQSFRRPWLGMRDYPADCRLATGDEQPYPLDLDLGPMPLRIHYRGDQRTTVKMYDAKMVQGTVQVPRQFTEQEFLQEVN